MLIASRTAYIDRISGVIGNGEKRYLCRKILLMTKAGSLR